MMWHDTQTNELQMKRGWNINGKWLIPEQQRVHVIDYVGAIFNIFSNML